MTKQLLYSALIAAIVAVVVSFVGLRLVSNPAWSLGTLGFNRFPSSGVSARYFNTNPTSSVAVADGSLIITGATSLNTLNVTSTVTFGSGVTFNGEITLGNCGTTEYTIEALSPVWSTIGKSVATTSVTVSGVAFGDVVSVSSNSTTSPLSAYGITIVGNASSGVVTVGFHNMANVSSTAITTSTIKACYAD